MKLLKVPSSISEGSEQVQVFENIVGPSFKTGQIGEIQSDSEAIFWSTLKNKLYHSMRIQSMIFILLDKYYGSSL